MSINTLSKKEITISGKVITSTKTPKKIIFYSPAYGVINYDYVGKSTINIVYQIPPSKIKVTDRTAKRELTSTNSYSNIFEYMKGKVAGVQVREDNTIRIRGSSSLKGSSDPLFVLNKMVLSSINGIININPLDIKSIEVLKGADTTLYGVRGVAGVIEITTY